MPQMCTLLGLRNIDWWDHTNPPVFRISPRSSCWQGVSLSRILYGSTAEQQPSRDTGQLRPTPFSARIDPDDMSDYCNQAFPNSLWQP